MSSYMNGFMGGMTGAMVANSIHSTREHSRDARIDELEAENKHLRVLLSNACERVSASGRIVFFCSDGKTYIAEVPK